MNIDEVAEFLNQKILETSEELAFIVPDSISKRIERIDQKVSNFRESQQST